MMDIIWRWDYVNNLIYDFFIRSYLEIIFLWTESSLGNFKVCLNDRIFSGDIDRNVICWIDSSCISTIDHLWDHSNAWDGSLIKIDINQYAKYNKAITE